MQTTVGGAGGQEHVIGEEEHLAHHLLLLSGLLDAAPARLGLLIKHLDQRTYNQYKRWAGENANLRILSFDAALI